MTIRLAGSGPTPRDDSMQPAYGKWALAIILLVAGATASLGEQPPKAGLTTTMVAMRDGVKLATDVYLPGDGKGKYPAIVARTPYGKSQGGLTMATFARLRGFAFVVQ